MLNNKKKLLIIFTFLFFAVGFSRAIVISTSENLGEIGTVGFVDMDEIFNNFPETKKAKKAFRKELKKQQKKIDKKKQEVSALKNRLIKFKEERMLLNAHAGSEDGDLSVLAASQVALPGYTPEVSAINYDLQTPQSIKKSSPDNNPNKLSVTTSITRKNTKEELITPIKKLDIKIQNTEEELREKQSELNKLITLTRREFTEFEKIKKQNIFVKIHQAVKETAIETNISVVVRKKDILFGQKIVDLTGKVLERINNPNF